MLFRSRELGKEIPVGNAHNLSIKKRYSNSRNKEKNNNFVSIYQETKYRTDS